jgi:hypothetical protein
MFERKNDTVTSMKEQAATLAQTVIEQAANRAVSGVERARDAASQAKGKVPGVTAKVNEDVVPSVREIALQAASAALDLWQAARERAEEVVEAAQHDVAEPAAHAVGSALHAVGTAERNAREAASQVIGRSEEAGAKAREASKHAAEATVSTGKDTGAALFWAGAAAGIIFYAMLDKERREQVLRTADAIIGQARELLRDFKGYDEEFV